jgi:hypothetical protein
VQPLPESYQASGNSKPAALSGRFAFFVCGPRVKTWFQPWAYSCRPFREEPPGIPPITFAVVLLVIDPVPRRASS